MTRLRLYSRPGCHLCEVATELLHDLGLGEDTEQVNIENRLDDVRRYGNRIPVLQRVDSGAELAWPFDAEQLEAFARQ